MKKYLFCKYLFETYYIKQILYYYQEKEKKYDLKVNIKYN